jgi:hypothetical protein
VFMLRISDPLQINQWGISGPNHHWWWKFVASCYAEDKDRLHGMETHSFSSKKKFKTVDLVPRIMAAVLWNAEDLVLVDLVHRGETACSSLLRHTRQTEGSSSNNETVTTQHCWGLSWPACFSSCKIMFPCHMPPLLNLHHTASQEPVLDSERI